MNFKVGDIVVPTCNNLEVLDNPTPRYRIYQIGMGRVFAENLLTGETGCDLAGGLEPADYYYELEKVEKERPKTKVTNKEIIDYCNAQAPRCEGARCKYRDECDAYFEKYGVVPGNENINHPENYTEDITLIEALAEVYNFNPRKKRDAQIIFEITDEDEPDKWLRFGKCWNKFEHRWSFIEHATNCPCLGCEERHFVSNLMANGFAKSQMIYGAQQGTFKVRKVCDTRIDNAWHHELRPATERKPTQYRRQINKVIIPIPANVTTASGVELGEKCFRNCSGKVDDTALNILSLPEHIKKVSYTFFIGFFKELRKDMTPGEIKELFAIAQDMSCSKTAAREFARYINRI